MPSRAHRRGFNQAYRYPGRQSGPRGCCLIRYEHPLNERIRTMMRLEDLLHRARYFSTKSEPSDHHAALNAMFESAELAARAALKSDLLLELERQRQQLSALRENPQVAAETLDEFLSDIVTAA